MSAFAPVPSIAPVSAKDDIRVMVVDDAIVVRSLMSRWIGEQPGLALVAALRSGREAVDQFEQHNPDVVVLDVDMPELDGISTLPLLLEKKRDLVVIMASALTRDNAEVTIKALRRLPGGDGPKVVFCTTENDVAHIARALSAGANEYIMKPFDKEIVEAKFQEVGLI